MQLVTRQAQKHLRYFDCPHHRRVTFQYKLQSSLSYIRDSTTQCKRSAHTFVLFETNTTRFFFFFKGFLFVFCFICFTFAFLKEGRERETEREKKVPINIDMFGCTYVFFITDIRRMHCFNDQHEIFFHKFWILSYEKIGILISFKFCKMSRVYRFNETLDFKVS